MKRVIIATAVILLIAVVLFKSTMKIETVAELEEDIPEIEEEVYEDKIMELANYIVNHKHFDFMRNVKISQSKDFYKVLDLEEIKYYDLFDNAANIHYELGDIYLFHIKDLKNMNNTMTKTINLSGRTLTDNDRDYKSRYMVATCKNYLIVALVNVEKSNETKELLNVFYDYFGRDNLENIYELLIEPNK